MRDRVFDMKRYVQTVVVWLLFSVGIGLVAGAGNAADRLGQSATDPLNATYLIEGKAVTLMDGRCELPAAPGSAMKTRTTVFGQPIRGDLDRDGDQDAVLLLTQDPGGSGTFYYVAAAVNVNGRYQGTNAVLLGDRIDPINMSIRNDTIVIEYADRCPEEPMSVRKNR